MPRSIDHLVIISDDLDTAVRNAHTAGFTVVPGGTHGDGNTHNSLIAFQDGAYIELIAPTEQGKGAEHRWFGRLRKGGGFVDFCLLSDDLATETEAIRERGVDYPAPFGMAREKPDGTRIAWKLCTPPGAVGERGWPFIIEDTTPRELRVPHEQEETQHANGATGVAGVTVLIEDLERSAADYEAILGVPAQPLRSPLDDSLLGVIFALGPHWILLTLAGSHEAQQHLQRVGQGPYRITLRTHDGPISPGIGAQLDPTLFSGAKIALA